MKVQFRDHAGRISKALRAKLEGRLGLALGKFADRIERVSVRISQIAGEACCRIEVDLRAPPIRTEGAARDPLAAADHAISRAASSVERQLERERFGSEGR
jgi:ribosome-associated translation inhibitor RaiA